MNAKDWKELSRPKGDLVSLVFQNVQAFQRKAEETGYPLGILRILEKTESSISLWSNDFFERNNAKLGGTIFHFSIDRYGCFLNYLTPYRQYNYIAISPLVLSKDDPQPSIHAENWGTISGPSGMRSIAIQISMQVIYDRKSYHCLDVSKMPCQWDRIGVWDIQTDMDVPSDLIKCDVFAWYCQELCV